MTDPEPALTIRDLTVRWGEATALHGVDLTVAAGERLALLGPSGSGKSTLLRCIAGLHEPLHAGEIHLHGRPVARQGAQLVPPERRGVAMVFQDLALWPHMTVRATLRFACGQRYASADAREHALAELVSQLGLTGREGARPAALSGGEQQRLALGRALISGARLLLLDEPFAALDLPLRREILQLLLEQQERLGFTLIHVTHDPLEALHVASRVALLEHGEISWTGPPADLLAETEGPGGAIAAALRAWAQLG